MEDDKETQLLLHLKAVICCLNLRNTYRKLVWVDPVVFRKLHIKLYVKITFFKGITILWHSFTSNYTNTSYYLDK